MAATAAAVIAGIGAITSIIGGNKAARAAKQAAQREAQLEGLVTIEKMRQLHIQERIQRGETIAQVAGSGVKASEGSPLTLLAEQAREFAMQRQITHSVGASKATAALQGGSLVANQAKFGSYSNAANQFANMFSLFGQAGT